MKAIVFGMKSSKGKLDNGQEYDSTKVFVQTRLDESKGNAKGFATVEYNFGLSDNYDKYKHLPFPFHAEIELETVTSGRVMKTVVTSVQPLQVKTDSKA